MKTTIRSLFRGTLLLMFLMTLSFCSENTTVAEDQARFEIEENDLKQDFEKEASSITVPVETNLFKDDWSVSSSEEWCTVTQSLGDENGILISLTTSEEPEVRTAEVTVKSAVENYTIQVRQLGHGPAILVKDRKIKTSASGGQVQLTVTTNIELEIQKPDAEWITEVTPTKTRGFVDYDYSYRVAVNTKAGLRKATFIYSGKEYTDVVDSCSIVQLGKTTNVGDVEVAEDIKIQPTGGKASENQPGQGIENSYDGIIGSGSPYHSVWMQSAKFPVSLEYFFEGKDTIDYIVYYTRSGNGNFGELDLYTATEDEPEYKLYGSFDFKMQNAPSRINFKQPLLKGTKIKFMVKSGQGDFVSCDEMEFYKKNRTDGIAPQLLTVFKDITCTELKEEVTDEEIETLPTYFQSLAYTIKNDSYDEWEKDFRIREYQPYSDVEEWAEKLITKRYSNLDNPTGLYVEENDTIVVLVGDTHGHQIALQSIPSTETNGMVYYLEEGVNKIKAKQTGALFVMYTADPSEEPIKIHIPLGSGKVNGFFDLEEHQTDAKYSELLQKATYKYFIVRGEKIIFNFHLSKMREFVPNNILSAIHLWDDFISWQQELMGIDDVRPSQVNNHIFAISPETGYMWANHYQIGFVYTYLNNILLKENVMSRKDNAWGPAHEIGHIHQGAIDWPSSTESSNNLFSNYALYKLGKYCSRGSELSKLAYNRYINHNAWYNMGSSSHMNEDTEIHLRMNWQLWNYYHRCGFKPDFWPTLFKLMRDNRVPFNDPGRKQLHFAKMASKAANQNLTKFFELWGFFIPVDNVTYEQYGTWNYNVTQAMIDEAKQYMSQYPDPEHAFYYIEDRRNGDVGIDNYEVGDVGHYSQFENDEKITKEMSYTLSGQTISVQNGEEAVAFEINKADKVIYFFNFLTFNVPNEISLEGTTLYAVQADGTRIEIPKSED